MALTKVRVLDKVEVSELGFVIVRWATRIFEDGVQIGNDTYLRTSFEPGATLPANIEARVSAVTAAVWTPEVVDAYRTRRDAMVGRER